MSVAPGPAGDAVLAVADTSADATAVHDTADPNVV